MKILSIVGFNIILDDEDYEIVSKYKWYFRRKQFEKYGLAYFQRTEYVRDKAGRRCQKNYSLHRDVLGNTVGFIVDHINGNTLDNRRCNLRLCTISESNKNKGIQKNNYLGLKGVYWEKSKNRYRAHIKNNGKRIHLGYFRTVEEAIDARNKGTSLYHGEFGRQITRIGS